MAALAPLLQAVLDSTSDAVMKTERVTKGYFYSALLAAADFEKMPTRRRALVS